MNEDEIRAVGKVLESRAAEMSLPVKLSRIKVTGESGYEWHFLPIGSTRVASIKNIERDLAIASGISGLRVYETSSGIVMSYVSAVPTANYEELLTAAKAEPGPVMAFGFSSDGSPVLADLSKPRACHIGVFAQTQSGKTNLSQVAISTLCAGTRPRDIGILILDHKTNSSFAALIKNHVVRHATTPADWMSAMRWIVRLMDERAKTLQEFPQWQRIVIYCDEIAEVIRRGGDEMNEAFGSVARLGAGLKVHLFVCTQRPSSDEVKSILKSQIKLRLVGKVGTPQEAALCSGRAGTGAEKINKIGQFIAVSGDPNGGNMDVFCPLMVLPNVQTFVQEAVHEEVHEEVQEVDDDVAKMVARIVFVRMSSTGTISDNELCRRCRFTTRGGEPVTKVGGGTFFKRWKSANQIADEAITAMNASAQ